MLNPSEVRLCFTAYIKKVILSKSLDYKRKLVVLKNREIQFEENNIEEVSPLLVDSGDTSFYLDGQANYSEIENLFSDKKLYLGMKNLPAKYKQVLFLSIIKDYKNIEIANILNLSEGNVKVIKLRAINMFLKNIKKEDDLNE